MTLLLRLLPPVAVAVAVAVLVVGAAWWLYDSGGDAERGRAAGRTIETQRSITDADARGPRTPDAVDRRLRDGTF